jgi:hypothetical protein
LTVAKNCWESTSSPNIIGLLLQIHTNTRCTFALFLNYWSCEEIKFETAKLCFLKWISWWGSTHCHRYKMWQVYIPYIEINLALILNWYCLSSYYESGQFFDARMSTSLYIPEFQLGTHPTPVWTCHKKQSPLCNETCLMENLHWWYSMWHT